MKIFLSALLSLALFSPSVWANDEEDDSSSNCQVNQAMENAQLACVSCGIQKYYQQSGKDVVPSEKWLAFLGVATRNYKKLNPDSRKASGEDIVRSDVALQSFQWNVIAQVQAYGFCTEFLSKDTKKAPRSKAYRDLSSEDWTKLYNYLTRSTERSEKEMNDLAKNTFGFADALFSDKAQENMKSFINDENFKDSSIQTRRETFRGRLNKALAPEYDVSGERTGNVQILQNGSSDQGMRKCLEEIRDGLDGKTAIGRAFVSSKENYSICRSMASSCQLKGDLCGPSPAKAAPVAPRPTGGTKPTAPSRPTSPRGLPDLPPPPGVR